MSASRYPCPADYDEEELEEYEMMDVIENTESDDSFESSVMKTRQNLKMTIIPDKVQTAGLNGQPFDATLPPEIQDWFDQFKQMWNQYKKGPVVSKQLEIFYSTCGNPFLMSLKLFADCPNLSNIKPNNMAYTILEELQKYKKSQNPKVSDLVDDNLKMVVFNLVKGQGQVNLFRVAKDTFNLVDSKKLFVDEIRAMTRHRQYKEACQIATELELFEDFDLYELVLPLLLQDKISVVEDYLKGATHLRRPLVQLLDTFLDRQRSVRANAEGLIDKYNYPGVQYNKLDAKPLIKLVTRFAKMYNLPKDLTPNMNCRNARGVFFFLVRKRFIEKTLNTESWHEMVKDAIPFFAPPDLQVEVVNACSDYGDTEDGARWAKYYNLPLDSLPIDVREFIQGIPPAIPRYSMANEWDEEDQKIPVHSLRQDVEVSLVTTRSELLQMIDHLQGESLIGFDSEWKPTFHANNEVALIQLATRTKVYLIDVICLRVQSEDWTRLGRRIFNNDEILKLGFSAANDIGILQKSLPGLNLLPLPALASGFLDLLELRRRLETLPNFHFPHENDRRCPSGENLSNLVYLCVGRQLDKSNQFSNWEKRPLRQEQITYAALDAFCLLEIHDVIQRILTGLGYDFADFINNFLTESRGKRPTAARK